MERVAACLSVIAVASVFPRFDFRFHLQRQYPSIATTAHVRRTSFLADVQLVCKCFSTGTAALPGGRHLRVLSVERSTANATDSVAFAVDHLYLSILMLHLLFT